MDTKLLWWIIPLLVLVWFTAHQRRFSFNTHAAQTHAHVVPSAPPPPTPSLTDTGPAGISPSTSPAAAAPDSITTSDTPTVTGNTIDGPITYRISSSCPTGVTYLGDDGNTQQEPAVDDGWSVVVNPGDFANVSAQLTCAGGTVSVSIELDGAVVATTTSSGDYVTAEASFPQ
ncbi:hypothetical protein GCM10008957_30770 [Deinococcus ruber]|uniref:Uncharacterized protein n=2 Tax=Deinococcus ruber TaxID=1848197 RepID=A0A918CBK3_9DEIO|nr:hypothetical protein GCM10008957_30770 [Deinococcus ruber]